jgi:hypothetical protein
VRGQRAVGGVLPWLGGLRMRGRRGENAPKQGRTNQNKAEQSKTKLFFRTTAAPRGCGKGGRRMSALTVGSVVRNMLGASGKSRTYKTYIKSQWAGGRPWSPSDGATSGCAPGKGRWWLGSAGYGCGLAGPVPNGVPVPDGGPKIKPGGRKLNLSGKKLNQN